MFLLELVPETSTYDENMKMSMYHGKKMFEKLSTKLRSKYGFKERRGPHIFTLVKELGGAKVEVLLNLRGTLYIRLVRAMERYSGYNIAASQFDLDDALNRFNFIFHEYEVQPWQAIDDVRDEELVDKMDSLSMNYLNLGVTEQEEKRMREELDKKDAHLVKVYAIEGSDKRIGKLAEAKKNWYKLVQYLIKNYGFSQHGDTAENDNIYLVFSSDYGEIHVYDNRGRSWYIRRRY